MLELRDDLLDFGLTRLRTKGDDSEAPNNCLDLHRLNNAPSLRLRVAKQINKLVTEYTPDLIVPVPDAEWLAVDLAQMRRIEHLRFGRNPNTGRLAYRPFGQELREAAQSIVIVDDTLTDFRGTQEILGLIGTDAVKAVVGVWNREPELQPDLGDIAVRSLISEYIPPRLTQDSPFWEHLPPAY